MAHKRLCNCLLGTVPVRHTNRRQRLKDFDRPGSLPLFPFSFSKHVTAHVSAQWMNCVWIHSPICGLLFKLYLPVLTSHFVIRGIKEITLHRAQASNVKAACKDMVYTYKIIMKKKILRTETSSEIYRAKLTFNTLFLPCMQKSH